MTRPLPPENLNYDATFENEHGERWWVYEDEGRLYFTGSDLNWERHDCTDTVVNAARGSLGENVFEHVIVSFEEWAFLVACLSCWKTRQLSK